jgi:calcineurin-like phosphoesterase family protein
MNIQFITSDEHYGHESIIQYCNRPYATAREGIEFMIQRHNSVVPRNKNVVTLHAGDMFWHTLTEKEASDILYQLNGNHAFLYGNHDELMEQSPWLRSEFLFVKGENKVGGAHLLNWQNRKILVSHFSHRAWERSHKGSWHVYGHSHQELPGLGRSFDIGVEGHDYRPWSMEEIAQRMATLDNHHVITKVWNGKEPPREDQ